MPESRNTMHIYTFFIACVLASISGAFMLALMDSNHNWGGDFSQYIAQAQALINGTIPTQIANNTLMMHYSDGVYGPNVYPWGYPLLLAPVLALFGENLLALKCVNIAFFMLFIFCFYAYVARRFSTQASIALSLAFALNPMLLNFASNNILSDISYMCISFVAVVGLRAFVAPLEQASKLAASPMATNTFNMSNISLGGGRSDLGIFVLGILGGILALAAYLIRSNGIAVLATLCALHLYFIARIHTIPRIRILPIRLVALNALPYVVFVLGILLVRYTLDSSGGEGHIAVLLESISLKTIVRNALYYAGVFCDFFALPNPLALLAPSLLESKYAFLLPNPLGLLAWGVCVYFLFLGLRECYKRDMFAALFVGISLGILIIWPALQGIRFVFCVLPFFAIWIASGVLRVYAKHPKLIIVMCALLLGYFVLKDSYHLASKHNTLPRAILAIKPPNPYPQAFDLESKQVYAFITTHTSPSDTIVFFKPRVLYLATNRLSYSTSKLERLDKAQYLLESSFAPLFDEKQLAHLPIVYASEHFTLYNLQ